MYLLCRGARGWIRCVWFNANIFIWIYLYRWKLRDKFDVTIKSIYIWMRHNVMVLSKSSCHVWSALLLSPTPLTLFTYCVKRTERLHWISDAKMQWIRNESIYYVKRNELCMSEWALSAIPLCFIQLYFDRKFAEETFLMLR